MSQSVVSVDRVRKSYGTTTALDDVSLTIDPGQVVTLLGPNGAGKTTLVRAITGTTPIDSGTVTLFGSAPEAVEKERLGVLPQSFRPPERLTPRELLEYYGGLYADPMPVHDVLRTVGMADKADVRFETLSGGQQRRTTLGIALINNPDLLILDEPTTGIDPAGRRRVHELVDRRAERGTSVLLTTHDIDEAERLANHAVLLANGRVVGAGSPGALIRAHGGANRIIVETDGGVTTGVARELDPVPNVTDTRLVFSDVAADRLGDLVRQLDQAGIDYHAVRWARPDLEDVYLELTDGRLPGRGGRGTLGAGPSWVGGETSAQGAGSGTDPSHSPDGGDPR